MKGVTLVRFVPTVVVFSYACAIVAVGIKGVALSHPRVGKSPVRARQLG